MKRCSKKKCCKECRHVKFKGTITKWPYKNTHRTTQTYAEHQYATDIQKTTVYVCVSVILSVHEHVLCRQTTNVHAH